MLEMIEDMVNTTAREVPTKMSDAVPKRWVATQMPSQAGKVAIVTGANSGIGFVTALELARHGAVVVLACRSEERGKEAQKKIEQELKGNSEAGRVEFHKLDVSSLSSVKAFVAEFKKSYDTLDLLINNAGIMAVPYAESADGYESQFATNHLGHFALTAQLMDTIQKSPNARIVNLSSLAHRQANVDLKEIVTPKDKYKEWPVYQNSKVYNLLFTFELNRRFKQSGISNVIATACHPGFTATNLGNPMMENSNWFVRQLMKLAFLLPIVQTSEYGALPTLYAATGENVKADDYFGPDGLGAMTGYPTKEEPRNVAKSEEHAKKLWEESERLAKLSFEF